MSYVALYRKWRPDEFEEVKGQEHVVTTLKNQITHDRVGHAYLFCGTRGTGKTTVAKLFAKAVNCENPREDGSPCNECATCKAISLGSSLNVKEIDAASNNGVDNIRDIRDDVQYTPTEGKYKVYIIDEVHMLSAGAFNALLKTLEEPPSYVIFILATTESHKIPVTILSRCQKYDFRRISLDTIYERLMELLGREGIEAEEKAVRYVAKTADGSMRDALSLLDQCISFYLGQKLTYEKVLEVLGVVDIEVFNKLTTDVSRGLTMDALAIIDEVVWQGRELSQFVMDYTWYLRDLMLLKVSEGVNDQLDLSAENIKSMLEVAENIEINTIMRYIRVLSELSNDLRYVTQKRVALEVAVIRLTTPMMQTDETSILERLRVVEKKIEESGWDLSKEQWAAMMESRMNMEKTSEAAGDAEPEFDREEVLKRELTPAQYEDMGSIVESIKQLQREPELYNRLGNGTTSMLHNASINIGPDKSSIVLTFDRSTQGEMAYLRFSDDKCMTTLKEIIGEMTGKNVQIVCQQKQDLKEEDIHSINLSKINMTVREED